MNGEPATKSPQSDGTFGMTDLQEALQGEDKDKVRRGVVSRLGSLMSEVTIKLETGVAQGQLEPTQKIYSALARARGLML